MKVVADTNVLVSALIFPGAPPEVVYRLAIEEQIAPGDARSISERYQAAQPTGRYTTVEEIANMVLFLSSDLASNTTGGQFVVDGGRTATGGAVTNLTAR